jgi:hypothetical protein
MASDITVNRGTTYVITHIYKKDGVASDDGATLLFTVKANESDLNDADSSHLGDLLKNISMSGSTTTITLDPADSQDIEPGRYWYDIKIIETGGQIYRVAKGRFILDASPTNRLAP